MNAETLPQVDQMMVRKITPLRGMDIFGGVLVLGEYDVLDVGVADHRNPWDEDVVDCSNRILEITSAMIMQGWTEKRNFTVFPSRRWRNFRVGETEIIGLPSKEEPLLYLGNPVRLFFDPKEGTTVASLPEFMIKSGAQLEYEQEMELVAGGRLFPHPEGTTPAPPVNVEPGPSQRP